MVYSASAPLGIAIGISIVNTYNPNSATSNLVQGTFDAVSAGILIYVGFCQMLAVEFAADVKLYKNKPWKHAGLYLAVYIGASVMAFIGKYL